MSKFIYIVSAAVILMSCTAGKISTKNSSNEKTHKDSTVTTVDTSKVTNAVIAMKNEYYGDTLTGSLAFTNEQIDAIYKVDDTTVDYSIVNTPVEDSLESSGLKVKVTFVPVKGGLKAKIKAVARPKESSSTRAEFNTQQKGETTQAKKTEDTDKQLDNSTRETKGFPWTAALLIGALLILIIFIIIILIKRYG